MMFFLFFLPFLMKPYKICLRHLSWELDLSIRLIVVINFMTLNEQAAKNIFYLTASSKLTTMDFKKTALATIGGSVVLFLAGWFIWDFILGGIQSSHTTTYPGLEKESPSMLFIFLAQVFFALLITIIFQRWAGITTLVSGAQAGAVIAILIGLGQDSMFLGMTNMYDSVVLLTNIAGNLLWGALGGAVIAWILGR